MILTGEDKDRLSEAMREIGKAEEKDFMMGGSPNVDNSICVVVIGCKDTPFLVWIRAECAVIKTAQR